MKREYFKVTWQPFLIFVDFSRFFLLWLKEKNPFESLNIFQKFFSIHQFTFHFQVQVNLCLREIMPKFTRKIFLREQVHIQQRKEQINKEGDANPRTEKHLLRPRLNFIWDSRREKFKWKYIFVVFEHEALRHMIRVMLRSEGKRSRAKHWNKFLLFSLWHFH